MAKKAQEDKFFTKLGVPLASLKGATQAIEANRFTGNVICLVGDAGIGKTHIVRQIAAKRKPVKPFHWRGKLWEDEVPCVIWYLAHMQSEDTGVPYPSRAKRNELLKECELFMRIADQSKNGLGEKARAHAERIAAEVLNNGNDLDDGTYEFLLEKEMVDLPPEALVFLDEWNRADKSVIKAFFTLLEDREMHGKKVIPDGCQLVAAMNPSDGAYSVNEAEKDHAFRRRLSFVAVTVNPGVWLEYAQAQGEFHDHVVDFMKASPDSLYDIKLRDAGKAFPCPATWEKVSHLLKRTEEVRGDLLGEGVRLSIAGHIGDAMGLNFDSFLRDRESIINPSDVIENYKPKSSIRRKVQKMVNGNRNDVLNKLCEGLSVTLLTSKPEPKQLAPKLALFMGDLQSDMAISLVVHKFNAAAEDVTGGDAYINALSKAMYTQPAYKKLFKQIAQAMKEARKEMGEDASSAV
jgi:hypothetical protein